MANAASEKPGENEAPKIMSPKRRFRALVRLVIANLPWLLEYQIQYRSSAKKRNDIHLELEHKALLNKPPKDRTDEDNEIIFNTISGFKFYRKYSEELKRILAAYSEFVYYGADRTIVKCNNYATAIFFIVHGEVNVIEEKYDKYLQETYQSVTETLFPGDVFGELCLLHDLPRMETIVSITPVEFLILKREYFDLVLRDTVKAEWDRISEVMLSFEYFQDWDTVRIGECCMQSFLCSYKKGDIILGSGYGRSNYIHFVIEGSCVLIEHMHVNRKTLSGDKVKEIDPQQLRHTRAISSISVSEHRSSALSIEAGVLLVSKQKSTVRKWFSSLDEVEEEAKMEPGKRQDTFVYMQVCTFNAKACFSLGEPMTNRCVIADSENCTCMLIPAFLLLGRDCMWLRIKQFIFKEIPDSNHVRREYIKQAAWRKYKQELVQPLCKHNCYNLHGNIPYTIRIHGDFKFKPGPSVPYTRQQLLHMIKNKN